MRSLGSIQAMPALSGCINRPFRIFSPTAAMDPAARDSEPMEGLSISDRMQPTGKSADGYRSMIRGV
jgi:hypothetical protein